MVALSQVLPQAVKSVLSLLMMQCTIGERRSPGESDGTSACKLRKGFQRWYSPGLYEGMYWQDVTFAQIEQYPDAVFWFSPEAFCYYLPGILAAGLRENRWDLNAYDALIGSLDRSPRPDYWDDFFLPRWTRLTTAEVNAVAAWARWLALVQPDAFHSNTYDRVQDTLTLLKERQSHE